MGDAPPWHNKKIRADAHKPTLASKYSTHGARPGRVAACCNSHTPAANAQQIVLTTAFSALYVE
jgi:hypothetical protein